MDAEELGVVARATLNTVVDEVGTHPRDVLAVLLGMTLAALRCYPPHLSDAYLRLLQRQMHETDEVMH